ncbi:MAG: LamG domain-containing protein [Ferruginibacter sp.]
MKIITKTITIAVVGMAIGFFFTGCQKMERPVLKELILDPEPPAYNDLKSFWSFENNFTDAGEGKLAATPVGISYVAGVTGQAAQVGAAGYILLPATDVITYPNGYVGKSGDTLAALGSFTLSFWMKGVGPVINGAQGLFSISNKAEFWGNLDLFLENNDNGSEAFLKVHMFNAGVASGNGEQWSEVKIPGALNKWTHIAVTYESSSSKFSIYADGVPTSVSEKVLGDGKYGKLKFNNFNGMVLGSYQFQTTPSLTTNHGNETWARSFNGALDQFRIYNRSLAATEINELFTTKK